MVSSFKPASIEVFVGGAFEIGRPTTVKELRAFLMEADAEMSTWGDDTILAEVWAHQNVLHVTLSEGLVQP